METKLEQQILAYYQTRLDEYRKTEAAEAERVARKTALQDTAYHFLQQADFDEVERITRQV
jgi:hypothetical protein